MNRAMGFTFHGYSGVDVLLTILPKAWQSRIVARRWMKAVGNPDPLVTRLIINMPWGTYRIVDAAGRLERCAKDLAPPSGGL